MEDDLCEALSKVCESLKTKHRLALSSFEMVCQLQTRLPLQTAAGPSLWQVVPVPVEGLHSLLSEWVRVI